MGNNVNPGATTPKVPVQKPTVTTDKEESVKKPKREDPHDGLLDNDEQDADVEFPAGLGGEF
jgi:hypothetical protein